MGNKRSPITVMNPSDEMIAEWLASGQNFKKIGPNLYEVVVQESWEPTPQDNSIRGMIREAFRDHYSPLVAVWRALRALRKKGPWWLGRG